MRRYIRPLSFLLTVVCVVLIYGQLMLRFGAGSPPHMASSERQADMILVDKSDRTLTLLRGEEPIRVYEVSLGGVSAGHKLQEGDEKTPEGVYIIDWRNENSIAHLSLHISYPNQDDITRAKALGVSPGGNIMIHGILNGWGWLGWLHRYWDWTNGCIAVTNTEMQEIWSLVPNGTPIHIKP